MKNNDKTEKITKIGGFWMVGLLLFREKVRNLFFKYDFYIIAIGKFFLSLIVLLLINAQIGYSQTVNNPFLIIGLSLICAFLSPIAIAFFSSVVVLANFAAVSVEISVMVGILFFIMFLFYFIFKPGNTYLAALSIIFCFLQMPGCIAVVAGLIAGPITIIPIIFAMIFYTLINGVSTNFSILSSQIGTIGILQKFIYPLDILLKADKMWGMVLAIVLTICIVYWIRQMSIPYSWDIAVAAGTVSYTLILLIFTFVGNMKMNLVLLFISAIVGGVIAAVYQFFVFAVDYSRTEYTQFEDDDYYYYVKAVPKIKVTDTDVKVTNITAKTTEEEKGNLDESGLNEP